MVAQPDDSTISRDLLEQLLGEGVEEARTRERTTFEAFAGPLGHSIVLAGAGRLGRRCLTGLRGYGVEPLAFVDNNSRLWGSCVDGVSVLSPSDAARRFGKTAVFVVTIWGARPSDRMNDRVDALRTLGCDKVTPFGPMFWRYPDRVLPHYGADLPHKVLEQSRQARIAFDVWADVSSRREYIAQLRWRLFFDFDGMSAPDCEHAYFPPDLVQLTANEVFVDCGAFDGDTIRDFLTASNYEFERISAFEPDPANSLRLGRWLETLPIDVRRRIKTTAAAVAASAGVVNFSAEGGPSSHLGEGALEVPTVALDAYLDRHPTFIKMDIEGSEPAALAGAARHIREHAPILAISCYHQQDHLWIIPLLIHSLNPEYRLFLRPHDFEGWDLVCYAIPRSRYPNGDVEARCP